MLKQSYYMLVSQTLRLFAQAVLLILLARQWGVETFGSFMYAFTVSALLVLLVDYGFGLQIIRDVGKNPKSVSIIVGKAFLAKLVLSGIVIIISIILTPLVFANTQASEVFWLLLGAAILASFGLLFNLPFRALGRFEIETKTVFWASLLLVVLVGSAGLLGAGPLLAAVGFLIARLFYLALSLAAYRRSIGNLTGCGAGIADVKGMLVTGLPFAVHIALGTLYLQIDTVIIQHFLGPPGVGTYQAGLRLVLAGLILSDVLTNVYVPRLAQASGDREKLIQIGSQMTRHQLLPGAVGLILLTFCADRGVSILYGNEYQQVSTLLPLMAIVFFLRYLGASYGALLTVSDRQAVRAAGVTMAVLVNIALNLWLIPKFGLRGAVLASILTHILLDAIYMIFAWQQVRSALMDLRGVGIIIIAAAGGFTLMILTRQAEWLRLSVAIIGSSMIVTAGFKKGERNRLFSRLLEREYADCVT